MQAAPLDSSAALLTDVQPAWALGALGVLAGAALALIAWKLVDLSVKTARSTRLLERIDGLVERRMIAEALAEARAAESGIGRVFSAGLARRADGAAQVARSLENARVIEIATLERGLIPLAAIAALAPLLGFLGSVVSLMRALEIPRAGGETFASALVPAAAGLVIAIPVTLMHAWFVARVRRVAIDVTGSAQRAIDAIHALDAGERAAE